VVLWLETFDIGIENTDARYVAFLRMLAEKLLANADTEDWLFQVTNNLVKSARLQIFHRLSGMSLTRKQHAISLLQLLSIVGQ
jgi:hypothetical protein